MSMNKIYELYTVRKWTKMLTNYLWVVRFMVIIILYSLLTYIC